MGAKRVVNVLCADFEQEKSPSRPVLFLVGGAVAEPPAGIEPATYSLRVNRSADLAKAATEPTLANFSTNGQNGESADLGFSSMHTSDLSSRPNDRTPHRCQSGTCGSDPATS